MYNGAPPVQVGCERSPPVAATSPSSVPKVCFCFGRTFGGVDFCLPPGVLLISLNQPSFQDFGSIHTCPNVGFLNVWGPSSGWEAVWLPPQQQTHSNEGGVFPVTIPTRVQSPKTLFRRKPKAVFLFGAAALLGDRSDRF